MPSWQASGSDVKVVIKQNGTDATRTGEVVIKAGSAMVSVAITQNAPLSISTKELHSPSLGKAFTVEVNASAEWTVASSESWCKAEAVDQSTLSVITEQSDLQEQRTAIVTVTMGAETAEIKVIQESVIDREITTPEGYQLVWHDEFNEGTTLGSDWVHEVQRSGWVNNELQNYVNGSADGKRVTELVDGKLVITCFKGSDGKIYSGRVYAKPRTGWTYGYFEARMMLPKGKGTWPAYWMMPVVYTGWPHCGEIDIMEEVGVDPNICSSSIHCSAYNHPNNTQKTAARTIPTAQTEYHIYALEWTPDGIRTYIDGQQLFYFANDGKGDDNTWPFHVAFYPIFNLAWGGDWGGYAGVDENALPAKFSIDYIRIFQK